MSDLSVPMHCTLFNKILPVPSPKAAPVKATEPEKMQEDVQIKESVSLAPLEKNEKTIGMQVELYGIRLNGVFSDRPEYVQKPIKIKFNEHKQGPSCLVKFV